MSTRANLYVDQGVDFVTSLNLFTDVGDEFDITTQEFSCDVRKVYSSTIIFSADIMVEPGNVPGLLEMEFSGIVTANTDPGKYQYDLIMTSSSGKREKILEGLLFLLPTITRG
jgi:hypothetical protein